jgi:hypothetical protein
MSGSKLENRAVSKGDPSSKRLPAEDLAEATMAEVEKSVDVRVERIQVRSKVAKAVVVSGGTKPVPVPEKGPLS